MTLCLWLLMLVGILYSLVNFRKPDFGRNTFSFLSPTINLLLAGYMKLEPAFGLKNGTLLTCRDLLLLNTVYRSTFLVPEDFLDCADWPPDSYPLRFSYSLKVSSGLVFWRTNIASAAGGFLFALRLYICALDWYFMQAGYCLSSAFFCCISWKNSGCPLVSNV